MNPQRHDDGSGDGGYFTVGLRFDYYDSAGKFLRSQAEPPPGWNITMEGIRVEPPGGPHCTHGGDCPVPGHPKLLHGVLP